MDKAINIDGIVKVGVGKAEVRYSATGKIVSQKWGVTAFFKGGKSTMMANLTNDDLHAANGEKIDKGELKKLNALLKAGSRYRAIVAAYEAAEEHGWKITVAVADEYAEACQTIAAEEAENEEKNRVRKIEDTWGITQVKGIIKNCKKKSNIKDVNNFLAKTKKTAEKKLAILTEAMEAAQKKLAAAEGAAEEEEAVEVAS